MSLQENDLFDGVRDKVKIAIERLQYFEPKDGSGYYVAFSGGKDSIVVKDLVIKSGTKYDIHFNVTSVDPPELMQYIKTHHPDVERHMPERTMFQLWKDKMMPPTRKVRFCCEVLKERGGKGRNVVTGVRWAESARRAQRRMFEAKRNDKRTYFLHPIIDWSDAEVWQYIHANNLPYCKLYDEGMKRIGCIGCPMSSRRKEDFKRWPAYERAYRAAAAAAAKNIRDNGPEYLSRRFKGRALRWETGEAMFSWWMEETHNEMRDENQSCMIFE